MNGLGSDILTDPGKQVCFEFRIGVRRKHLWVFFSPFFPVILWLSAPFLVNTIYSIAPNSVCGFHQVFVY